MKTENRASNSNIKNGSPEDRWPDCPGWEVLASTIETLAKACGGSAQCHKKYEYLSVSLESHEMPERQYDALCILAELVEQVSDTRNHGEQSTVSWVRRVLARALEA